MTTYQRIGIVCLALMAGTLAGAQQAPPAPPGPPAAAPLPVMVWLLRDGVYWSRGLSNNGFVVGKSGVVVFDTRISLDQEKQLLAEFAKISDKPFTHVILSHNDGDHVNGLPAFPKGIAILAQEHCKELMQQAIAKGGERNQLTTDNLPTQTYDQKLSVTLDGVPMQLLHWAPAHTSGDTVLYLPKQKIAFTGDLMISEIADPFLHMEEGGSASGYIQALRGMIALDADLYVAGHGDLVTKPELQRRLARYEQRMAQVKMLHSQGQSLEQIKLAMDGPPPPPGSNVRPDLVDFTYHELTQH